MFLMPWARFAASHDGGDSMRYCNYEALTDEEMAFAGSRQLQFVFGARDTHGQVSRGTVGTTNSMMSFSPFSPRFSP